MWKQRRETIDDLRNARKLPLKFEPVRSPFGRSILENRTWKEPSWNARSANGKVTILRETRQEQSEITSRYRLSRPADNSHGKTWEKTMTQRTIIHLKHTHGPRASSSALARQGGEIRQFERTKRKSWVEGKDEIEKQRKIVSPTRVNDERKRKGKRQIYETKIP